MTLQKDIEKLRSHMVAVSGKLRKAGHEENGAELYKASKILKQWIKHLNAQKPDE